LGGCEHRQKGGGRLEHGLSGQEGGNHRQGNHHLEGPGGSCTFIFDASSYMFFAKRAKDQPEQKSAGKRQIEHLFYYLPIADSIP
jgi:hypothetical protein